MELDLFRCNQRPMKHTKTEWAYLGQKRIKSVYYGDWQELWGVYDAQLGAHLLSEGTLLLGLDTDEWLSIEIELEREGLSLFQVEPQLAESLHAISLKRDPIWSQISNLTLKKVKVYAGHYFIGPVEGKTASKATRNTIIASIELVFQHGESLFVSMAAPNENHELEQSLFDIALYTQRKTGLSNGLITQTN